MDSQLGKQIRYLFNDTNDNDAIIHKIKILTDFIEEEEMNENDDFDSLIEELKTMRKKHQEIVNEKEKIESKLKKAEKKTSKKF